MKQETQALTMKKATLTAWTNILYKQGVIDLSRRTRMIAAIEKMKEPPEEYNEALDAEETEGIQMVG